MSPVGNIDEINKVKKCLDTLKKNNVIKEWELPYENLLTRLSAAIFFINPTKEENCKEIWAELEKFPHFRYRQNIEKKLSQMQYRVEFNEEN